MTSTPQAASFSQLLLDFIESEKFSGFILAFATLVALVLANSPFAAQFLAFWHIQLAGLSLQHWVNDGLMAVFFFLIGLELKRELLIGELSRLQNALLPLFAALGGMLAPAAIHGLLNAGTPTQRGVGIPMATDIAFALGVLALLGDKIPTALKVFVVAFAVIDDLGAIALIALFYTHSLNATYLGVAAALVLTLFALNKFGCKYLSVYSIGGLGLWVLVYLSGIHATLAGVLLAFTIPFHPEIHSPASRSLSHQLESALHKPVAFIVLPIFALANTGLVIKDDFFQDLLSVNSLGIGAGLILGKVMGVSLASFVVIKLGLCRLPNEVNWPQLIGAGLLGGIGFTMSIFIANLAFPSAPETVASAKMAVLLASCMAGGLGYLWLRICSARQ